MIKEELLFTADIIILNSLRDLIYYEYSNVNLLLIFFACKFLKNHFKQSVCELI